MSIPVQCPLCGVRFKARNEYGGKRVKCPQCGGVIRIPLDEETKQPAQPAKTEEIVLEQHALDTSLDETSWDGWDAEEEVSDVRPDQVPKEEKPSIPVVNPAPVFLVGSPASQPIPFPTAPRGTGAGGLQPGPTVPIWLWIVLACSLTGLVVGSGVYAALKWSGSAQTKTVGQADSAGGKSSGKGTAEGKKKPTGISAQEPTTASATSSERNSSGKSTKGFRSIREILEAVVKIELPVGPGKTSIGAGFIIDPRGWVATNYHVIAQASSGTRVRLHDETVCQVAGILAQEPSMDLAILKLADPPPRLSVLDISFSGDPELGEEIRVCGHPHNLSFTFVEGTVGRLVTTLELLRERPNPLLAKMKAPPDMVWIQHSARIAPGNSGGPVVNKQGQVLGINSFVNELAFGYAVPVRYLRALTALCQDDQVTPLPDQAPPSSEPEEPSQQPEQPGEKAPTPKEPESPEPPSQKPPASPRPGGLALSPEELQKLFNACAEFQWKPETAEQYSSLEVFARAMSVIKHIQAHPEAASGAPKEAVAACAEKADQLFAELQKIKWTKEHWSAIHRFATDRVQPRQGLLLQGSVLMNADQLQGDQPVLQIALDENEKKVLLQVSPEEAKTPVTSKVWIIGMVVGSATLTSPQGDKETCPVIQALYFVKLE